MRPHRARLARWSSIAGTLALCAGALLELWPHSGLAQAPARVALVVDLSQSVRARYADAASALEALAGPIQARCREAHEELATIAFGAEVAQAGARPLRELCARLDGSASELDAALEAARAALGPGGLRRIVLLSDGEFTGTDPRPRLAALAAEGVGLEWIALPPRERAELVLGEWRAGPARVGAPVALELPLALASGVALEPAAALEFEVEHAGARTRSRVPIAVPDGIAPDAQGWLCWPLRRELDALAAGETLVRCSLERGVQPAARAVRELVLVPEGSRPRGAVLGPSGGLATLAQGVEWSALAPERAAAELERFDVLLSTDSGWEALPPESLRAWIRRGGAWIACASPANLPQGWNDPVLRELLPLAPASAGLAPRDVIFLLDGSGSMVGEPWSIARAALAPLAQAAGPDERLFVQSFAGALGRAEPLGPGVPAREASGGPTALCDALEELARTPSERERLVVLLSDGQDRGGVAALARARELARALAAARITLAPIAIGPQADRELLGALASPGQELLACPALSSALATPALEALFRRQLGARRFTPQAQLVAANGSLDASLGSLRAALSSAPLHAARLAALVAREGAALLLTSAEGAPALALERQGLGWCVAVACDPSGLDRDVWNTLANFAAAPARAARARVELAGRRLRVEGAQAWSADGTLHAELRGREERRGLQLGPRAGAFELELAPELAREPWDALVLAPGTPAELVLGWPRTLAPEDRLPRPALEPSERRDSPARAASEPRTPRALAWGLLWAGVCLGSVGAGLGYFSGARARRGKSF